MHHTKKTTQAAQFTLDRVESLLAATRGEESNCSIFTNTYGGEFTDEQKRLIRMYVDTWIADPLRAVVKALDGTAEWQDKIVIEDFARDQPTYAKMVAKDS